MQKQYAIIYWKSDKDEDCYFLRNNNGSILRGNMLSEIDKLAFEHEEVTGYPCRVISLSSVKE